VLILLQDLSLFVNEVKRDNEMLHSLSMVQKRYIVICHSSLSSHSTFNSERLAAFETVIGGGISKCTRPHCSSAPKEM